MHHARDLGSRMRIGDVSLCTLLQFSVLVPWLMPAQSPLRRDGAAWLAARGFIGTTDDEHFDPVALHAPQVVPHLRGDHPRGCHTRVPPFCKPPSRWLLPRGVTAADAVKSNQRARRQQAAPPLPVPPLPPIQPVSRPLGEASSVQEVVLLVDGSRFMGSLWPELASGAAHFCATLAACPALRRARLRVTVFNARCADVYVGPNGADIGERVSASLLQLRCAGPAAPLDALVRAVATSRRVAPPKLVVLLSGASGRPQNGRFRPPLTRSLCGCTPGGIEEVQATHDVSSAAEALDGAATEGTRVLYLGCRHDALRCAVALGLPYEASLRFSPHLRRAALRAAAQAVVASAEEEAVAKGSALRVAFTADHRLFSCPAGIVR